MGTYGRSYERLSQPLFIGWRGAREVRLGCKAASVEGRISKFRLTLPLTQLSFCFKHYPHDSMYSIHQRFIRFTSNILFVSSSIYQII